ncbi:MAG TPA: hypothetical protein ENF21_05740 [Bacteroidetes bacterium]|nr:hypothetical protein [Bacteroidota bacterium]
MGRKFSGFLLMVWTGLVFQGIILNLHARQPVPADTSAVRGTGPCLFATDSLLYLTLEADFRSIQYDIGDDNRWHEARLILYRGRNDSVVMPVELETRGHFRRSRKICDFPPLRIRFDTDYTLETVFQGQKRLKMVTHCRSKLPAYEQFYMLEYLMYRIYNQLNGLSFRVRPAMITYRDISGKSSDLVKFSFFLEDDDDMASRNGGVIADVMNVAQYKLDYDRVLLFVVFQYFIGNTDWSVPALHNVKLFSPGEGGPLQPVPYDFDFSGAVDAPYAVPDPKLPISNVRQRLFRHYCVPREDLQPVFDLFLARKEDIYSLVNKMPFLQDRYRKNTLKYFDLFYKTIQDERKIKREFFRMCW